MESLTAADPQTVGEFRLRARLGAGGMGRVFLASSVAGRMVAVKVIHPELAGDPGFVRRFRAEVDAARRVSGLYTAPVVAAGVEDIPPWLATAFVPGPSLEDVVDKHGPLPVPALCRLAGGLAEALRAIHASGLVHRDLKPANVLLASDGPRVIDFGIARAATDTRLTATGAVIGTPSYMSPEQVEGLVCGPPSDVFSLGSVLAFAASGTSPFAGGPGGSSASVMYRIVHGEADLRAVPGPVMQLIAACLAKDPARRPDLAQVAAHCATAAEYLGLSASEFWPADVSAVIAARQADLAAQLRQLEVAAARPGSASWPAPTGPSTPMAAPAPTGPSRHDQRATAGQPLPATSHRAISPRGTSRRGVLIGGAAAGIAVAGGLAGWALSRQTPAKSAAGYEQTSGPGGPSASSAPAGTGTSGSGGQQLAWTFTTGNAVEASPGVGNGVVYIGSRDNYLYAVNMATGKQQWKCQLGWVTAAPVLVGDMVCAASTTGGFAAIHAATGVIAWQQSTGVASAFKQSWAVSGENVILPSLERPVTAYNAATGASVMTYGSADQYTGAVGAAGGLVYVIDVSGTLHALRADSGAPVWNAAVLGTGDVPSTGLVAGDGALFLGTDSGTLYCVDAATGSQKWSYSTGSTLGPDPAVGGGLVYVVDDDGNLHGVATASGKAQWSHPAAPGGDAGATVAAGKVYVSTGLALQALNGTSGSALWSYTPPGTGGLISTPAVAGGLVFIGSSDDSLYAIRA